MVDQEPEETGEQWERERLRPHLPGPRGRQDDEQRDHERRALRGPAMPRSGDRDRVAGRDESDVEKRHDAQAAECFRPVVHEMSQPLLVDPDSACTEHGDVVRPRQAVLDDLPAGDERQPTVRDHERRGQDEQDPDEAREEENQERVLFADLPGAREHPSIFSTGQVEPAWAETAGKPRNLADWGVHTRRRSRPPRVDNGFDAARHERYVRARPRCSAVPRRWLRPRSRGPIRGRAHRSRGHRVGGLRCSSLARPQATP